MALGLVPSDAGLLCLQAGVVLGPRALGARAARRLARLRGPAWALIPVVSIVGVIFAIRGTGVTADALTWLALVAIPLLAVAALGWLMRGARPWLAPIAPALLAIVWIWPDALTGQAAEALLAGLSCVTLGVLIGAVTPSLWLKLGILAMAGADIWLIETATLQAPNTVLDAAAPARGLPQLQSEAFGQVTLGYGDLFVSGLLGAVWSARPRLQWPAALLTLGLAGAFDVVFDLARNTLPATVPVALALIVMELWSWRERRRAQWLLRPVEAGGRDSSARLVTTSSPRAASSSTSVASSSERA